MSTKRIAFSLFMIAAFLLGACAPGAAAPDEEAPVNEPAAPAEERQGVPLRRHRLDRP